LKTSPSSTVVKSGAVVVTSAITVADQDNDTLKSAVVRIASGLVTAEDRLNFTSQNGITGSYVAATGTKPYGINHRSKLPDCTPQHQYENTNLINPVASTRTVSFTVNDGTDSNNTLQSVIVNGVVKGYFSGSQTICDDGLFHGTPVTEPFREIALDIHRASQCFKRYNLYRRYRRSVHH
jgi:hypothetical protein